MRYFLAYLVHALTATSGIWGLLSLYEIHKGDFRQAFLYIGISIIVDAVDGTCARLVDITRYGKKIDGALLDNILDFLTYVTAPAFLLLVSDLIPDHLTVLTAGSIMLASAYQFSQIDAKTDDHFFKGFPSYWNILVFYLLLWDFAPIANVWIILSCVILVFIPIKYLYPSQLTFVSRHRWVRRLLLWATIIWGISIGMLWWIYPLFSPVVMSVSVGYMIIYTIVSLYVTVSHRK